MTSLERSLALARQLLQESEELAEAQHDANGERSSRAEEGFARLDAELRRWFGAEGYHFMVLRVVTRTREEHPRLRHIDAADVAAATMQEVVGALHDVPPAEAEAIRLRLLTTFIAQLDRLLGAELATRLVTRAWWHRTESKALPSDQRTHE